MRSLALLLVVCAAQVARADGGTLRLEQDAGPFRIAVFSAPEPLRVGVADLSVLVQHREGGAPVLDASVALRLEGPPPQPAIEAEAARAQATNKLLYAAAVALPAPGAWTLRATVRQGDDTAAVTAALTVEPRASRVWALWPYLLLPPAAVAVFALREWRVRSRNRR